MFKNCCGCGKLKKVSDSSFDVEKDHDDTKDKRDEKIQEEGKKDKPESEKQQQDDPQDKKTEVVSSAAKNPGLVVDTASTVAIVKEDDDEEDDTEVFPITPRTANMATPHPSKRNSTPGLASIPRWLSQEDDDDPTPEGGGTAEPPVTPVGRDELALRRHRFFSDLLVAAQAATEHRVRFDPLGPSIAGPCECGSSPVVELNTILSRLENITSRLEKTVPTPSDKQNTAIQVSFSPEHKPVAMSVSAYSDIIRGPLTSYLTLSGKIGGDVASHAKLVGEAFQAQLQYLQLAASRSAPNQAEEMQFLLPTSQKIQAIQELREKNRASPNFNHLSAISESIPALGWVTVRAAPAPYIKEMNDAGQFYTNRVLKDWKQKDQTHVDWVKAWVETLTELQKFVKQHHTTGLVWSGTKSGGGVPPPPPGCPPPPPVLPPIGDLGLNDSSDDRSALFAEINQGENITKNLKKVTSDMQTHKNASLRSGPAPFKAPPSTGAPTTTPVKPPANKPPVFAKDGKKWLIEYQHKNQGLVVEGAEMNNVVYMYGCTESTLTVKGKINSVFLDSCKKSAVVFDSLVSSVEFVNCQSVQMQVLGKVPTISIDKTDGCQIYLSKDSLDVEIVSSKSSEMNVLVPKSNGDFAEYPVPEQFKTTVKPTGLTTIAVESKG